jgi:hypothetical protein
MVENSAPKSRRRGGLNVPHSHGPGLKKLEALLHERTKTSWRVHVAIRRKTELDSLDWCLAFILVALSSVRC